MTSDKRMPWDQENVLPWLGADSEETRFAVAEAEARRFMEKWIPEKMDYLKKEYSLNGCYSAGYDSALRHYDDVLTPEMGHKEKEHYFEEREVFARKAGDMAYEAAYYLKLAFRISTERL